MTIMLHCYVYLFFTTFFILLFVNSMPNPLDVINININDHLDKANDNNGYDDIKNGILSTKNVLEKGPFKEPPLSEKQPADSNEPTEDIDSDEPNEIKDSDEPKEVVDSDKPKAVDYGDKPKENVNSDKPREDADSDKPEKFENSDEKGNDHSMDKIKYGQGNGVALGPTYEWSVTENNDSLCSDGEPSSCTCCDGKSMTDLKPGMCANCFQGPPYSCTCSDGKTVNKPCKMAKMENTSWCYSKHKWNKKNERPLCSDGEPTSCTCCDGKSMTDLEPGMCANCFQGPPHFCTCSDGKTFNKPCKMAKMENTSWCYSKIKWKKKNENN